MSLDNYGKEMDRGDSSEAHPQQRLKSEAPSLAMGGRRVAVGGYNVRSTSAHG